MQEKKIADNKASRSSHSSNYNSTLAVNTITQCPPPPGVKQLSIEEQQRRRDAGLCFNCEEKYFRGHKCKSPAMVLLMEIETMEHEIKEEGELTEIREEPAQTDAEEGNIDITLYTTIGEVAP